MQAAILHQILLEEAAAVIRPSSFWAGGTASGHVLMSPFAKHAQPECRHSAPCLRDRQPRRDAAQDMVVTRIPRLRDSDHEQRLDAPGGMDIVHAQLHKEGQGSAKTREHDHECTEHTTSLELVDQSWLSLHMKLVHGRWC